MSLNPGARSFVPRVSAPAFVPGGFAAPAAVPVPAPVEKEPPAAPAPVATPVAAPVATAPSVEKVTKGVSKLVMSSSIKIGGSSAAAAAASAPVPTPAPAAPAPAPEPVVAAAPAPAAPTPASAPASSWEEEPKPAEAPAAEAAAPAPAEPAASSPVPAPAAPAVSEEKEEVVAPKKKEKIEFKVHDEREHLNCVFIGHVDAGKSTTCGNILVLSGSIDERTIAKYEREAKEKNRESWYLAYVMDTNEEERAKGKTVEVGRAHFATAAKRYTILDAPGHKNYVPNMVVGAAQADIGVLIISAKKGEFESGFEKGGQTREHAMLAKTLGVTTLVVAINKMDDPTVNWDKGRYDEIETKLTPFLKNVCGYNIKRDVVFMPISGLTGAGLRERVNAKAQVCPWYQGPGLIELLDGLKPIPRDANAPLRLPIVDRYKEMGVLCVNGKVESGMLSRGMKVTIMPPKLSTEITAVLVDEVEVDMVRPGESVVVKLKSLEEEDLHQGYVICPADAPCKRTQVFDAQIAVLELLPHKPILSAGYTAVLHVHSLIVEVIITEMLTQIDKKTGEVAKKRPTFCRSGDVITCRIQAEMPVAVETFKDVAQMGRFTLRDEGKTIAMGKVLKLKEASDMQ